MHLHRLWVVFVLSSFLLICIRPAVANDASLDQQISQMLMVGFDGTVLYPNDPIVADILAQRIGGVVLYAKDFHTKDVRNIKNPHQLKVLTEKLQAYAMQAARTKHTRFYPLLIAVDYEGGKVVNLKEENGFPKTFSAAQIGKNSEQQAKEHAEKMARTLKDEGINLDFAPVVDVNINPDNPIIGKRDRSFSADTDKVTTYARIFSQAFHDQHVLCTYKHFPGHGSSDADSHLGFVDVTRTWQFPELTPYKQLFKDATSCGLVMTAHVVNRSLDKAGYPASLSYAMTTDLLRKQLGFKGVIITDDLQMKAIADHYDVPSTVQLAIKAGADILLFSNQLADTPQNTAELIDMIKQAVQSGKISADQIAASYDRVIKLKENLS